MNTFLLKRRATRICKNSRGFTLIEILVVMAIIGILLAIAVPAIIGVIAVANRAKDKANATNVKTAVLAYNSDYGTLPVPSGAASSGSDAILGPTAGSIPTAAGTYDAAFYNALCGNSDASVPQTTPLNTGLNTRNIPYLNLTKSQTDGTKGILIQAFPLNGQPTYFGIIMDANYDNIITGLPDPTAGTMTLTINDVCAIWCSNDQAYAKANIRWSTTY